MISLQASHHFLYYTLRHNVWNVHIIGLFKTVTLLDQLRYEKIRSSLLFPSRALWFNRKVSIKHQWAECSRQEGDSQGNKTNTYQPFCSGYLNQVSKNSWRDWTELPVSFCIKLSSDSHKAHCRQYKIKRQTITQVKNRKCWKQFWFISLFLLDNSGCEL